jgi:Alpha/beta hydrolase domain
MTKRLAWAALALALGLNTGARAHVTRIEITKTEPAFGGVTFGDTGAYQVVTGIAHGELDPALPGNAVIQDLTRAPRNAKGMVEYATEIQILKPVTQSLGNHVLLFEALNRGNKLAVNAFNADVAGGPAERNALSDPGDGFLFRQGYTLVWFGWQQDVVAGANRMLMPPIVAHNPDGSAITGIVRDEIVTQTDAPSLRISASWQGPNASAYPAASLDNRGATLTVRAREQDPREPIPNDAWTFAKCAADGAATPDPTFICLKGGFHPGRIYELVFQAKDPLVMGIGFAAARDLGTFLRNAKADVVGTPNPVYLPGQVAVIEGSSQSGRMIRTLLHLGFNRGEDGKRVFDGAYPHIGGGLLPLNIRFAQPNRAWGEQVDHTYPAYDFPFTYARQTDPLTGRSQGLLDRCGATNTCPRIFHVATALEMWEGRQSLGLTDPLGQKDVPDPPNVRTYLMTSTQHGPAGLPLPTGPVFGNCQQQSNPNPQVWTMRALLSALTLWVRDNAAPPPSMVPTIAAGEMVAPDQVRFPPIPANTYGAVERPRILPGPRVYDTLHVLDRGPGYHAGDSSGVITREPPGVGSASYGILVPQVDADGNDLGGVRSVFVQVPIGTYTGWNTGRKDRFENGFCNLQGSFIPFAKTKAEREAAGDPRPSLEERYASDADYAAKIRVAAEKLVAARMLLPADAARLELDAQKTGIRTGP